MKINTIAIDDEPMALSIVEEYIHKTPFLKLEKLFTDSIEALTYVQENAIDLIFLDINMPDLTGLQFLNTLEKKPLVIFTTAYSEYAVKSYDYRAVDYLLKPIEFERFLKAALRAKESFELTHLKTVLPVQPAQTEQVKAVSDHIYIKSGTELHKLMLKDILYIEGTGNYISVVSQDKRTMTLTKMSEILNILPNEKFIRVHKSYIVSMDSVEKIERHQLTLKGRKIPIGITYRERFFRYLDSN